MKCGLWRATMASSILGPCLLTSGLLGEFRVRGDCSLLAGVLRWGRLQLEPQAVNDQIGGSLLSDWKHCSGIREPIKSIHEKRRFFQLSICVFIWLKG